MKRLYPDQPVIGIGAVVISDGIILLEKRKNEPGKGKWSIPGGLVDLGETAEQAVIRGVKEETGLEVVEPQLVDVVSYISFSEKGRVMYHFVIIDYLVTSKRGKPQAASDADDLRWVPFNEVEEYDLTKSFRYFFQRNRIKLENASLCF